MDAIKADPDNPEAHSALAQAYSRRNRHYAAHAVMRSAATLDATVENPFQAIPAVEHLSLDHNKYYRFRTLQRTLQDLAGDLPEWSFLDVGGGDGQLASFLPEAGYFLAEPIANGLDSNSLPFEGESFDFVVCCHVLEHIPKAARDDFLDGLMSHAKKALVLLNPFDMGTSAKEEGMELFVEYANAGWAKEHLECLMPKTEDVEAWAGSRNYDVTVQANGTAPVTFLSEMFNVFSKNVDRGRINTFLNTHYVDGVDSETLPNGYLLVISRRA